MGNKMTSDDIKLLNRELADLNKWLEYLRGASLRAMSPNEGYLVDQLIKYLQLRCDTIELKLARYKVKMGWS